MERVAEEPVGRTIPLKLLPVDRQMIRGIHRGKHVFFVVDVQACQSPYAIIPAYPAEQSAVRGGIDFNVSIKRPGLDHCISLGYTPITIKTDNGGRKSMLGLALAMHAF